MNTMNTMKHAMLSLFVCVCMCMCMCLCLRLLISSNTSNGGKGSPKMESLNSINSSYLIAGFNCLVPHDKGVRSSYGPISPMSLCESP